MSERRRSVRHEVAGVYYVDVLGPDGRVLGAAAPREVSAGGALLFSSHLYRPGSLLALAPKGPHGLAGRKFAFRVTRGEQLPGGGYVLAGAFLLPLSDELVNALAAGCEVAVPASA